MDSSSVKYVETPGLKIEMYQSHLTTISDGRKELKWKCSLGSGRRIENNKKLNGSRSQRGKNGQLHTRHDDVKTA